MHLSRAINNRALSGLLIALACTVAFLSDASVATASIVSPSYGTFALESGDLNERADLAVSRTSTSRSTAGRQATAENERASGDDVLNWQRIPFDASSTGATGTSTPTSLSPAGSQAVLRAVNTPAADLRVIGWLRDASHIGLPEVMPRSLLRPPQA